MQQPPDPYAGSREDTPYLPPGPGPARLVREGGAGPLEFALDAPVVTIGRSRTNEISLDDARVSRQHVRIIHDGRGYAIEDLNSRNGTLVDDRAVRGVQPLADGAKIRIGDSTFRFTVAPAMTMQPPGGRPAPYDSGGQQAPYGGQPAGPYGAQPPSPYGGGQPPAPYGGGQEARSSVPEVFSTPWSPVQCPSCQGLKTMRPMVYGPAAHSPGAQIAAQRGEVVLGEGPPRPEAPNAECRACGTRVRIVTTGG